MLPLHQQIRRTDPGGMPVEWIDYRDAARLYALGQVAYACGDPLIELRGGINSATGRRGRLAIHSIIATHGTHHALTRFHREDYAPPLADQMAFLRADFPRSSPLHRRLERGTNHD